MNLQVVIEEARAQGANGIVLVEGDTPHGVFGNAHVQRLFAEAVPTGATEDWNRQLETQEGLKRLWLKSSKTLMISLAATPPVSFGFNAFLSSMFALLGKSGGLYLISGPMMSGKTTALRQLMGDAARSFKTCICSVQRAAEFRLSEEERGESAIVQIVATDFREPFLRLGVASIVFIDALETKAEFLTAMKLANEGRIVVATIAGGTSTAQLIEATEALCTPTDASAFRDTLARVLKVATAQKLFWVDGKLLMAMETLVSTPQIANLIRENKAYRIPAALQTSHGAGCNPFDEHLLALVRKCGLPEDVAIRAANDSEGFAKNLVALKGQAANS